MEHDITYDEACECCVWWYNGTGMCLVAETLSDAKREVDELIAAGIYPEDVMKLEGEEDVEYYDDSMDGDFDSAMASAGVGTDEDYGRYSDD